MGDDLQRQHDLTIALQRETALRQGTEARWRDAIAEAHAAGVSHVLIPRSSFRAREAGI
jgi:hypothetical protein